MDHINTYFTNTALDQSKSVAIRAAVGLAKKTLNCYFSLTDSSEVYQIVMGESMFRVLHLNIILITTFHSSIAPSPQTQVFQVGKISGSTQQKSLSVPNSRKTTLLMRLRKQQWHHCQVTR